MTLSDGSILNGELLDQRDYCDIKSSGFASFPTGKKDVSRTRAGPRYERRGLFLGASVADWAAERGKMSLQIVVKSASNLPNLERFSKSDPMTVLVFQGVKHKTKVISNNLDPMWDETFEWPLQVALSATEVIQIEVFDHEKLGKNRLLGRGEVSMRDVVPKDNTVLQSH